MSGDWVDGTLCDPVRKTSCELKTGNAKGEENLFRIAECSTEFNIKGRAMECK